MTATVSTCIKLMSSDNHQRSKFNPENIQLIIGSISLLTTVTEGGKGGFVNNNYFTHIYELVTVIELIHCSFHSTTWFFFCLQRGVTGSNGELFGRFFDETLPFGGRIPRRFSAGFNNRPHSVGRPREVSGGSNSWEFHPFQPSFRILFKCWRIP